MKSKILLSALLVATIQASATPINGVLYWQDCPPSPNGSGEIIDIVCSQGGRDSAQDERISANTSAISDINHHARKNAADIGALQRRAAALEYRQSELWDAQVKLGETMEKLTALNAALSGLPSAPDNRWFVGVAGSSVERTGFAATLQKGYSSGFRWRINAGTSGNKAAGTLAAGWSF